VQDAVVNELQLIWEPDRPLVMEVSGIASDLVVGASDIAPADPTGPVHLWDDVVESANSGIRINTTNPPVQADELVASRVTFTMRNNLRYAPFLGNVAAQQARIPVRNGFISAMLEVVGDVEDTAANWNSADAALAFQNKTGLNLDLLSYVGASDILELKASAATQAAWVETFEFSAPNEGAMQCTSRYQIMPAALADFTLKITSAS